MMKKNSSRPFVKKTVIYVALSVGFVSHALVRVPRTNYFKTLPTNPLKTKNSSHSVHNIWLMNTYNHTGL
ncbi:MAG: hypothetical protein ACSLE0_04060 [Chitinophagaceae bacterium]